MADRIKDACFDGLRGAGREVIDSIVDDRSVLGATINFLKGAYDDFAEQKRAGGDIDVGHLFIAGAENVALEAIDNGETNLFKKLFKAVTGGVLTETTESIYESYKAEKKEEKEQKKENEYSSGYNIANPTKYSDPFAESFGVAESRGYNYEQKNSTQSVSDFCNRIVYNGIINPTFKTVMTEFGSRKVDKITNSSKARVRK